MTWKHLKKPAVLVASLAIVLGLAPAYAFAAEGGVPEGAEGTDNGAPEAGLVEQGTGEGGLDVQANGEVDSVSLTVTPPEVGTNLSMDASENVSSTGEGYSVGEAVWQEAEVDTVQVVDGGQYTMNVGLVASDGKTFKYTVGGDDLWHYSGTATVSNGEVTRAIVSSANPSFLELFIKVTAGQQENTPATDDNKEADKKDDSKTDNKTDDKATDDKKGADDKATTDDQTATDDKKATDTTDSTTKATPDSTTESKTTTSSDKSTTSSSSSSSSTMPKTGDSLPYAPFAAVAALSAIVALIAVRRAFDMR